MVDVVITHVDVLQGKTILRDTAIVIEDGYIKEFVNNDAVPQAKEVIDGKGMLAAPGLINTHTHIAMGLLRNYADDLELMDWLQTAIWPAEAKLTDHLAYWGTQLGIAEMFRYVLLYGPNRRGCKRNGHSRRFISWHGRGSSYGGASLGRKQGIIPQLSWI